MTEHSVRTNLDILETPTGTMDIYRQAPDFLLDQLIIKSKEDNIQRWTPKDAAERFTDRDAIEARLAKKRQMYFLASEGDLKGVVWYGPKPLPQDVATLPEAANHIFAIRMYESGQGQGLAKPFMDISLKDYILSLVENPEPVDFRGIWLSTGVENKARILYSRYGYTEIGFRNGEVYMTLSEDKIRQVAGA